MPLKSKPFFEFIEVLSDGNKAQTPLDSGGGSRFGEIRLPRTCKKGMISRWFLLNIDGGRLSHSNLIKGTGCRLLKALGVSRLSFHFRRQIVTILATRDRGNPAGLSAMLGRCSLCQHQAGEDKSMEMRVRSS